MQRVWAMPSRWTFTIKPIRELLERYVGDGYGWIDPFAGKNSPAEFQNDLNPKMPTQYHMHALDFVNTSTLRSQVFNGVLFDPPYSSRQTKECYESIGFKLSFEETKVQFCPVKDILTYKIKNGGFAISFGWSSVGFGKCRDFEIVEILLVCHGGHHNDTIVTVERRK